ncbi:threonylcarbamoyl-AMP synthase [Candidatus Uhrbacteria bacterium]|nr:threonylcarbamoyl-AMP synthase [Candidatus Uhrbacteria bacterium]
MKIVKISAQRPDPKAIQEAARVIARGGLVVFPTETVYGLGANAFDARAVRKIFKVKGRPEKKPLIVHVSKKSTLDVLAQDIPAVTRKLVAKFWPGPLTLVLKARSSVPKEVTGGGDTVAIRMPAHRVALALIRAAGPIAAPSANFSGHPPPREVREISRMLRMKVDMVLDGGRCTVGVPSTVVDCTVNPPKILRKGVFSKYQLGI